MLRIVWGPNKELESNRIVCLVQIAFSRKQVYSVKTVIAPAFSDFKVGCKLSYNLSVWVSMVQHFNSVLILLCLSVGKALEHLKEHTDVVALGDTVSIRVDLESPCQPTSCDQRRVRINNFVFILGGLTI
jgi:hypothetical protein